MPKRSALKFRDAIEARAWITDPKGEPQDLRQKITQVIVTYQASRPDTGRRAYLLEGADRFLKAARLAEKLLLLAEARRRYGEGISIEGALPRKLRRGLESLNDKSVRATSALASRFHQVAELLRGTDEETAWLMKRTGSRLSRCARGGLERAGYRCGTACCPRCEYQRAKKYQREIALKMRGRARMGAAPFGFALLTLTVSSTRPADGFHLLKRSRAEFARRRSVGRAIVGGKGQVHAEPARGADLADVWNVHLHAIVELGCPFNSVDTSALGMMWAEILAATGARGSFDLGREDNLTAEYFLDGPA